VDYILLGYHSCGVVTNKAIMAKKHNSKLSIDDNETEVQKKSKGDLDTTPSKLPKRLF